MAKIEVILVDRKDREIGIEEKIKAHKEGKLHRAISVFIFNGRGETLLQQRAKAKYHSGGLWANACCSHPLPNEDLREAAKRRLKEEMGINCDLKEIFSLLYNIKVGGLIEHEFDHIFMGKFEGEPKLNKKEVGDWRWISKEELKKDLKEKSENYAPWFKIIWNNF